MELWNNLWADLSQGMGNSQMETWNTLWADLSQGMANSQMEPWSNLWADLSQGMANSQMEPPPPPQLPEGPCLRIRIETCTLAVRDDRKWYWDFFLFLLSAIKYTNASRFRF